VYCGENGDGFLGYVYAGENGCCFGNTGETFFEDFGGKMR
jgi:hypothetical protein